MSSCLGRDAACGTTDQLMGTVQGWESPAQLSVNWPYSCATQCIGSRRGRIDALRQWTSWLLTPKFRRWADWHGQWPSLCQPAVPEQRGWGCGAGFAPLTVPLLSRGSEMMFLQEWMLCQPCRATALEGAACACGYWSLLAALWMLSLPFPSAEVFVWVLWEMWEGKDWVGQYWVTLVQSTHFIAHWKWARVSFPLCGAAVGGRGARSSEMPVDRLCSLIYPDSKIKIIIRRLCISWVLLPERLI